MCLRRACFFVFTSLHSGHPPQLWTIMLRQQLLLPVSLYDWFSHTIWLFNNCAEDMKRTPASSHQCHCQRASVPMATKERRGEKRGDFFFFFPPQPGWHPRWPVSTCWSAQKDGKIGAKGAKCKKFMLSLICLCYIIFHTLIFCFILKSVSLCSLLHFLSSTLIVCPSLVGITSVLLSFLIKARFSLLCHVGKSLCVHLSQFFFRRVPNCIRLHHILHVTSA